MSARKLVQALRPTRSGVAWGIAAGLFALATAGSAAPTVSQTPLSVGGYVPGNLVLLPSTEFPTMDSAANLGAYTAASTYVGYFDPEKCYTYHYVLFAAETDSDKSYFQPSGPASSHACSGAWSGNWLNWVGTQTIDPVRKALTGGTRAIDTSTLTVLEKARSDSKATTTHFPDRAINTGVSGATPASWGSINTRVRGLGRRLRFTSTGDLGGVGVPYDPAVHTTLDPAVVYEVFVRVKVCDASIGLEANCKQYPSGYKPEGLIQKYSQQLRFSVFSYLNDDSITRDGGVLRAAQKFVGPTRLNPGNNTWESNTVREWDANGVLITNPEGASTGNSGVINYLNKFGQLYLGVDHKSYDPVGELYYAALRYLKGQAGVPDYWAASGSWIADGFPVRDSGTPDPIQYSCQNNAILGFGDTNTHADKNLPGNSVTGSEPAVPALVSGDNTINVVTATAKVAELEGITINTPFSGATNSAYIAGLAYDAHTVDQRTESGMDGMQTISTYWVDVAENGVLATRAQNQFWLAAKYGGFAVPDGYRPYVNTTALAQELWTNGETLANSDIRPENFYDGGNAEKMVQSMARAFARITSETNGSASSLAANSTRLDTDTRTFQAQFYSGTWRGELSSYIVASDGTLSQTPAWRAGSQLSLRTWSTRTIKTWNGTGYVDFTWANLSTAQRTALVSQDVVDYLRGDRSKEESQVSGTLRTRSGVLGDIVNSTPTYVGKPEPSLYAGASFTGASTYGDWAGNLSRTPVVYVGANDGMLHGFNAETGAETFAYVPSTVISNNLKNYSDPAYSHQYYVDGDLASADVYYGGAWHTVLVGTLGRGGKGVFALDVTNPANVTFLWEKNATDIPDLGNNIGRPVIARVGPDDWRVLIGNGPNSTGEQAKLVTIGIGSGTVTTIATSDTSTANGLTAVMARDSDGDRDFDTVYAGDLKGNLWRFTNLDGTPASSKLFEARDAGGNIQPITAAPLVAKNPDGGSIWIFFGTGQYLNTSDLTTTGTQTWYGLRQPSGGGAKHRSNLQQRQVLNTGTIAGTAVRTISESVDNDMNGDDGWYIDLPSSGERMVVPNRIQGTTLIGTTRIPLAGDVCRPGGSGFVMAINPFTGARLADTYFDVDGNSVFNDSDKLSVSGTPTTVSGMGFDSGPNNPIFVEGVMQVGLDDGSTRVVQTQGGALPSRRIGWREILS